MAPAAEIYQIYCKFSYILINGGTVVLVWDSPEVLDCVWVEGRISSWYAWKIVDWDVQHWHKQTW